ncbi:hypothetical protein CEXT_688381 [Caerostris extrusa]|uniref:Uncharacterized protein n=1 Tax=Caerostris extrusa TaxID=172846 RepID=A0AAV4W6Z0_CAEEX|nr:hypothetical protein CEXT_688381 [Caerostris extrusa]
MSYIATFTSKYASNILPMRSVRFQGSKVQCIWASQPMEFGSEQTRKLQCLSILSTHGLGWANISELNVTRLMDEKSIWRRKEACVRTETIRRNFDPPRTICFHPFKSFITKQRRFSRKKIISKTFSNIEKNSILSSYLIPFCVTDVYMRYDL